MDEEISLIPMHPFFRGFVLSIVKTMREKNFGAEGRESIDADFVPKFSDNVMVASMGVNIVGPAPLKIEAKREVVRRDMSELVSPIEVKKVEGDRGIVEKEAVKEKVVLPVRTIVPLSVPADRPVPPRQIVRPRYVPPRQIVPPRVQARHVVAPNPVVVPPRMIAPSVSENKGEVDDGLEYGKISPLMGDPSISTIECLGAGKELMIVRAGQKQRTRIVLSAEEIKEILEKVADKTHIPLIEGIFRASVEKFSINAVVSELVGSRFVIKKATAYNLLE